IRARVEDALLLYERGRFEGAFLNALIAVAATSRRECPDRAIGDRECFDRFLDRGQRRFRIEAVEFRGQMHPIPHILYKWLRCELVHRGTIPIDVEILEDEGLSLRAGGRPHYVLQLSRGWFHWLVGTVVEAPCNASELA